VFINGHQVRWIDAKNYYGSSDIVVRAPPLPFAPGLCSLVPALLLTFPLFVHQQMQIQSMKKQANRYVEYWGPGAIVFALVRLATPAFVKQQDATNVDL